MTECPRPNKQRQTDSWRSHTPADRPRSQLPVVKQAKATVLLFFLLLLIIIIYYYGSVYVLLKLGYIYISLYIYKAGETFCSKKLGYLMQIEM